MPIVFGTMIRNQQNCSSGHPARNLHSVCGRYGHPLAHQKPRGSSFPQPSRPAPSARHGIRDRRLSRLEAVLFLAREPLSTRKLSKIANLADGTEARTLARRLNQLYDEEGRSFRVEELAGGLQLLTRPQLAPWLRRVPGVPGEVRLSTPALETLAVVAYRQPVLRAEIESIRGVGCGEVLRQLIERDLVRIGGRSEELGRPYLYSTTKRFLQLFGLQGLDDLPRREFLRIQPAPALAETTLNEQKLGAPDPNPSQSGQRAHEEDSAVRISEFSEPEREPLDDASVAVLPPEVHAATADDDEYDDDEYEDDDDEDDDDEDDDDEDDDEYDDDEYDDDEYDDEDADEYDDDEWEEVDDADADNDADEDDDDEYDDEDWEEDDDEDWEKDDDEDWEEDDDDEYDEDTGEEDTAEKE